MDQIKTLIEKAWDDRSLLKSAEYKEAVLAVLELLDKGKIRIAEASDGITFLRNPASMTVGTTEVRRIE